MHIRLQHELFERAGTQGKDEEMRWFHKHVLQIRQMWNKPVKAALPG